MKKATQSPNPILEDELGLTGTPVDEHANNVPKSDLRPTIKDKSSLENPEKSLRSSKHIADAPWYKRPQMLAALGLVLVLLVVGILGLFGWRNRAAADELVIDQWRGITQQADRATQAADRAEYDNMDDTVRELTTLSDRLQDADARARKQNTFLAVGNHLGGFRDVILDLKDYADALKTSAEKLKDLQPRDLDALQATGTSAETKLQSQKDTLRLTESLPSSFFKLSDRFETIITAHDNAENEKQAAEDATKSKEEQAKQDQADAEEAVSRWTMAYKSGDVNDMKRWMTAAYAKEYDFSEVTSSYRLTNYPVSYRRVSTEKKGDQYEVVEAITYVTKSDYAPDTNYTQTFIFLVSQDSTSKRWLVNSRRYSY